MRVWACEFGACEFCRDSRVWAFGASFLRATLVCASLVRASLARASAVCASLACELRAIVPDIEGPDWLRPPRSYCSCEVRVQGWVLGVRA